VILARLQSAAFAAGLLAFGFLVVAGVLRSFVVDHQPPPLRADYAASINALAAEQDWDGLLRQLEASAALDIGNPEVEAQILPNLVRLARSRGDRDAELFARRKAAELRRSEPTVHNQLSGALLSSPGPTPAQLREAALHSRIALALDPDSALATLHLAQIGALEGHREEALRLFEQAQRLDPDFVNRFMADLERRDPALAEAFHARTSAGSGT